MVILAVLSGGASSYGLRLVAPPRPDPWTSTEAREDREHHSAELDRRDMVLRREVALQIREVESRIRVDMPPGLTRRRIEALEDAVRSLKHAAGEEWHPPTSRFGRLGPP